MFRVLSNFNLIFLNKSMIEKIPVGDLIFLGTGTSHGVPMIGCECSVCQSTNPKNKRTRSSVILGFPEGNLLIDTSPDLRGQFLRERLLAADSILFTHPHVDHLFGLDDTRRFSALNGGKNVEVYCSEHVEREIRTKFAYVFDPLVQKYPVGGIPKLTLIRIQAEKEFQVLGKKVLPLKIKHGMMEILGFRIGNLAYCTDAKTIPEETIEQLYGLETFIVGCLRYDPHPTHMGLSEVLELVERIKPKRVFFTHIGHGFDHENISSELPANIQPAFDGLYLRNCF